MKKWLLFFILMASPAWATTREVSPSGSGTTCSAASPCSVVQAMSVTAAGDTINMQDGTYTGANYMVSCSGIAGSSGSHITLRAINDGQVLIDGQNARAPFQFTNCDYWDVSGMNVGNSDGVVIYINTGSDHNTFSRMCAWDASSSANTHVWSFDNSSNNVVQDACGFGTGRKIFEFFGGADHNVFRRIFSEWIGSTSTSGPVPNIVISYDAYNNICENCIATRDESFIPDDSTTFGIRPFFDSGDRFTSTPCDAHANYYGSIGYIKSGQTVADTADGEIYLPNDHDYVTFQDVVVYVPNGTHTGINAIFAPDYTGGSSGCSATASGGNRKLTNVSAIGFTGSSTIGSDPTNGVTQTNVHSATTVSGIYGTASLYINGGNAGATICFRYQDGVLTTTGLWPWPMNQRIIDAMTTAGYTAIDVDNDIQTIFGTFPVACAVPPPENKSRNLFESTVVR